MQAFDGEGAADYERIEIWRCPQLGGPVTLGYCLKLNAGLFCGRIVACWGGTIDVQAVLAGRFSPDEIERAFASQKDRVTTIVDALKEASGREGHA